MNEKDKQIESLKKELEISKKQLEKKSKQLDDYNTSRMTIFSNLSHEIRTPLNGIIGFSEILNTTDVSQEELKLYAGVIGDSCNLLMSLINDVFDIAKLESDTYKSYPIEFDLNDLVFNLFMEYKPKAEDKKIQLFLENLISEKYIIKSDPDILKRVLSKLLDNAIKFTKEGWVKMIYEEKGENIVFSVSDTGIGIAEALREDLFTRFITQEVSQARKIGGTGLDLSLCSGFVKLLGGEIWYESEEHHGSTFHFSFLNHNK